MQLFVVEDMFKIELDSYLRHLYPEVTLQNSLGILQLFQEVGHFSVGWVRNSPSTCNQVVFNSGLPHHKGLKEDQTCLCSRKTSGFNRRHVVKAKIGGEKSKTCVHFIQLS